MKACRLSPRRPPGRPSGLLSGRRSPSLSLSLRDRLRGLAWPPHLDGVPLSDGPVAHLLLALEDDILQRLARQRGLADASAAPSVAPVAAARRLARAYRALPALVRDLALDDLRLLWRRGLRVDDALFQVAGLSQAPVGALRWLVLAVFRDRLRPHSLPAFHDPAWYRRPRRRRPQPPAAQRPLGVLEHLFQ